MMSPCFCTMAAIASGQNSQVVFGWQSREEALGPGVGQTGRGGHSTRRKNQGEGLTSQHVEHMSLTLHTPSKLPLRQSPGQGEQSPVCREQVKTTNRRIMGTVGQSSSVKEEPMFPEAPLCASYNPAPYLFTARGSIFMDLVYNQIPSYYTYFIN